MKYSAADPGVRPHKQLGLIVPWTVFNLLACAWFVALFIGLVRGPTARRTPMLLSLYAVFVLATAAGPMLSWTGRRCLYRSASSPQRSDRAGRSPRYLQRSR
jgi:hypothetical protein